MSVTRLAVVTGANQGIGKEIVRQLSKEPGFVIVLTSRREKEGKKAVDEILKDKDTRSSVVSHQLDITDNKSIEDLANCIEEKYNGVLDILVNNAGIAYKGNTFGAEEAETTIATNVHGTMAVTKRLLPCLTRSPAARIVNVCSMAGKLSQVSPELQAKFTAKDLTEEALLDLLNGFVQGIRDGDYKARGYSSSMYGMSKLGELAYTLRILSRDVPSNIKVNAMCPGWCSTNMSSYGGPRTPAQGADTAVWLALQGDDSPHGEFFTDRAVRPW